MFIKQNISITSPLVSTFLRPFGQTLRQQERKYRGGLSYHHKDFTKNEVFKDHMKKRV